MDIKTNSNQNMDNLEKVNKQLTNKREAHISDNEHPKLSQEPFFLLIILVLSIFLGEIVTMIVLPKIIPPQIYDDSIIDALSLVVVVFPILYFFSFRPLRRHIIELRQAQEEVVRGEERYRSLVESTEDSIYLVDRDYNYLFANTKHQLRMGLSDEQLKGHSYAEYHSPEGSVEFQKIIDSIFETGKSIQQEHRSHRDNRYFLRTFSPVVDPFGMVEAVTVISKDISKLKNSSSTFSPPVL